MYFDRNEHKNEHKQVVALLGAGSMGTAIVRRIGAGKKILLGDISEKALDDGGSYLLFFKGKRIGKSEKMSAKCATRVLRIFRFFAFKISH